MKKPARLYLKEIQQPPMLGRLDIFPHDPLSHSSVRKLRAFTYAEKRIQTAKTDFEAALRLARYASEAWSHDGFNSNPKKQDALTILKLAEKGASFACTQFASVFVQVCQSVGIPARVLNARTRNAELGSSGHGHVTAEYFDNQLGKWVWIDPQIHAYSTHKSLPLSLNEFSELHLAGKNPKIQFSTRTLAYMGGDRKGFKVLQNFVKRYVWLTRIGGRNAFFTSQNYVEIAGCKRDSVHPPIAFQGFAEKMPVFLSREDFDAPLNACQMQFESLAPSKLEKYPTLADYRAKAHKNFALPKIRLHLRHSQPWFDHYELILNGKKKRLRSSEVTLPLRSGRNTLTVTPVNQAGRKGVQSKAVIHYDSNYPRVQNYW